MVVKAVSLHSAHGRFPKPGKLLLLATSVESAIWFCVSFQDRRRGTTPQRQLGTTLGVSHDQKLRLGSFQHLGGGPSLTYKRMVPRTPQQGCHSGHLHGSLIWANGFKRHMPFIPYLLCTGPHFLSFEKAAAQHRSKQHHDLTAPLSRQLGGSYTRCPALGHPERKLLKKTPEKGEGQT